MSRHALQSRLLYLKEAAYLLHTQAPTASAVAGSQYDKLLLDNDLELESSHKEWNSHRRDICGACGNLLIPGRSCQVSQESNMPKSSRKASKRSQEDVEKTMVYTCSRCDTKTIQPVPAERRPRLQNIGSGLSKPRSRLNQDPKAAAASDDAYTTPKSANASSKKRTKARKQGGLQALLDKSKKDSSSSRQTGFGLDLLDFMKST